MYSQASVLSDTSMNCADDSACSKWKNLLVNSLQKVTTLVDVILQRLDLLDATRNRRVEVRSKIS